MGSCARTEAARTGHLALEWQSMLLTALLLFATPQVVEVKSPAASTMDLFGGKPGSPQRGPWRAWLDSPGGELPFGLEMRVEVYAKEPRWTASLLNGEERIVVPAVSWDASERRLELDMPHYDARITATVSADGKQMDGHWRKRQGLARWTDMPFHARFYDAPDDAEIGLLERVQAPRFLPAETLSTDAASGAAVVTTRAPLAQRWRLEFPSSPDPAVGIFKQGPNNLVTGTILTTLGDYRFLAGRRDNTHLRLSCFDGAHAFLFDAQLQNDGVLVGMFYSSDRWQENWVGTADADVALPDAFAEVQLAPGLDPAAPLPLKSLSYPSLDGPARTLDDPELHGKATIISLFGSWCPNCNDEAALWAELYELYYPRGLRIIGLGFELSGEVERDKKQLLRFRERWNLSYPIFLAGSADKEKAQLAFPLLTQVKSFPTALFLDGSGRVRAIHSGFAGPATGQTGARLRARYVELIELLLAEEK